MDYRKLSKKLKLKVDKYNYNLYKQKYYKRVIKKLDKKLHKHILNVYNNNNLRANGITSFVIFGVIYSKKGEIGLNILKYVKNYRNKRYMNNKNVFTLLIKIHKHYKKYSDNIIKKIQNIIPRILTEPYKSNKKDKKKIDKEIKKIRSNKIYDTYYSSSVSKEIPISEEEDYLCPKCHIEYSKYWHHSKWCDDCYSEISDYFDQIAYFRYYNQFKRNHTNIDKEFHKLLLKLEFIKYYCVI